jgi:hypothetical protein
MERPSSADWVAMAEDWNVCRDRLEVRATASYPAYTAQSNYLIWFLRHQPGEKQIVFVQNNNEGKLWKKNCVVENSQVMLKR